MKPQAIELDHDYKTFENLVRLHGSRMDGPLFQTDADLWGTYVAMLGQHYNCHACRNFINRFGTLVQIHDDTVTSLWTYVLEDCPKFFEPVVAKMAKQVRKARIIGVYDCNEPILGMPKTGDWTHLHCPNPLYQKGRRLLDTADLRENYRLLSECPFRIETIREAIHVAEVLGRGQEKAVPMLKWYLEYRENHKGKEAFTWATVASAPAGWCHIKNSVAGTLLEDVESGMDFERVKDRWDKKLHPLAYQRPKSLTEGQIKVAEKKVADLGLESSLLRRAALIEDIPFELIRWKPGVQETRTGVFGHLKQEAAMRLPSRTMTYAVFERDVLPKTKKIEIYCPVVGPYTQVCTAVDPNAVKLFQWDNHLNWYLWHGGSHRTQFCLSWDWNPVTVIWRGPDWECANQDKKIFFSIQGCTDTKQHGPLFPETLKSEYRDIRHTIEAFSKKNKAPGVATASGLTVRGTNGVRLLVDGSDITIDRME